MVWETNKALEKQAENFVLVVNGVLPSYIDH